MNGCDWGIEEHPTAVKTLVIMGRHAGNENQSVNDTVQSGLRQTDSKR